MSILISLVSSVVFAVLFQKPLKRFPVLFYVLAAVVGIAAIYLTWNPAPNSVVRSIVYAFQKGQVGFALFTLVMFIGVFEKKSKIRRYFNPIRAELSIIACILIVGHFIPYLMNYFVTISSIFSYKVNVAIGFALGLVLLVLMIPLAITSFNAVKKRINANKWIALQRLSYVFFIFASVHAICLLAVSAGAQVVSTIISISIYTMIVVLYLVLRLRRAKLDKAQNNSEVSSQMEASHG